LAKALSIQKNIVSLRQELEKGDTTTRTEGQAPCDLSVLVRPERTLSKYFSARWFNLLIFRKMMAEEFECGCY